MQQLQQGVQVIHTKKPKQPDSLTAQLATVPQTDFSGEFFCNGNTVALPALSAELQHRVYWPRWLDFDLSLDLLFRVCVQTTCATKIIVYMLRMSDISPPLHSLTCPCATETQ